MSRKKMSKKKTQATHWPYVRLGTLELEEVLPFVCTREIRKALKLDGFSHKSEEWKNACIKTFPVKKDGKIIDIPISMGSDRYQLFVKKGCKCLQCGMEGTFFAIEKHWSTLHDKYHLNLYGMKDGKEVMLTKDHIHPVAKRGKNHIDNYQPLCIKCNVKKGSNVTS